MTAIVGVLNKHAVALAADSAVTLRGGKKVMNTATKLFALSKYHPVAIAVYGNAEFIGTPWEIIIKEYREFLGNKHFANVRMYVDNFQKFLKHRNYYSSENDARAYLRMSVELFLGQIQQMLTRDPQMMPRLLKRMNASLSRPMLGGFKQETGEYFKNISKTIIEREYKGLSKNGLKITLDELKALIEAAYLRDIAPVATTGLVFAGYGDTEIFPSIYNCRVGCVIDGLLAKVVKKESKIDKGNPSDICPFAQTDVMHTILDGVSPKMQTVYMNSLAQVFTKVTGAIAAIIENENGLLANQIRQIDIEPFAIEFTRASKSIQMKEYTIPFIESVATLEKEDLADFAESLITLTSLKRKISFDQETVGGPVDVMVISKGDGIIWMKRKEYFDSEKNPQYLNNYFNH